VVWEVDDHIRLNIPPLIIQPIVENAVEHGILKRSSGGKVCIYIQEREKFVEFSITDNGVGMEPKIVEQLLTRKMGEYTGIALLNTDRRLRRFYGNGLHIKSELGKGTVISFKIPK
jgi:sensor histidine kinase YesM